MTWDRRQTMRDAVAAIAASGGLRIENAPHIARTYGPRGEITVVEVEAEMMKHLSEEGDGK